MRCRPLPSASKITVCCVHNPCHHQKCAAGNIPSTKLTQSQSHVLVDTVVCTRTRHRSTSTCASPCPPRGCSSSAAADKENRYGCKAPIMQCAKGMAHPIQHKNCAVAATQLFRPSLSTAQHPGYACGRMVGCQSQSSAKPHQHSSNDERQRLSAHSTPLGLSSKLAEALSKC